MHKFWNALWVSESAVSNLSSILPFSWNTLSPDRKTSYSPIDSALSKFISSVLPHFIDFDFHDFLPDRFHQVYFQNIMFILVFFFLFNFCRLLCVILNLFDNFQIRGFFFIKTGVEPLYFTSFFLVSFLFFSLCIFFCFYFSISI